MTRSFYEVNSISKPEIVPVIFIVDASNTTHSIEWMKNMVHNCIHELQQFDKDYCACKDTEIQVGILSDGDNWITGDRLVPVQECLYMNLSLKQKGSIADAPLVLSKYLTKDKFLYFDNDINILQPSIIFLTNGEKAYMDVYIKSNINKLWCNEFYRSSNRIVISCQGLDNEELYVNLVHNGIYVDVVNKTPTVINDLISDLLINQWSDSEVVIEEKYKDNIHIRNIIISE